MLDACGGPVRRICTFNVECNRKTWRRYIPVWVGLVGHPKRRPTARGLCVYYADRVRGFMIMPRING